MRRPNATSPSSRVPWRPQQRARCEGRGHIARVAHACLSKKVDADGCIQGGTFYARLYKACSELGVIEDVEFTGNCFSKERIDVLEGFQKTYDQALELARVYDEALAELLDERTKLPRDVPARRVGDV